MSEAPAAMPERIGRYELLFPIGTGGMGTVYLGRTEVLPGVMRNVAVKLMHSELRANPEIAPQLMREAKLAASIQHPHVVAVLEAGDSPHGVFLVMDHVEGDTLAGLIRAARKIDELVPLRIAGKILHDALTGLHAAHDLIDDDGRTLDLVHRDFSPHNILVGVDGNTLLTDFGIAKALTHANATATGIVKGKVGYMAPEQARGERVDRRTDVWAAGVVAWELFTSRRLFRASNDTATLLQVVSGKRPPLVSSARRDIPDRLDEAIAGALEPKPSRRTATAHALRNQIEEALADFGGIADDQEVGAYLRELVGHKIAETKARAVQVLELRAQLADVSASATQAHATTDSGTLGTPPGASEFGDVSDTRAALSAVSKSRSATGRHRWVWGVAALAVGGALAAGVLSRRGELEPAATVASVEVPASPSASTQTSSVLAIVANEPIAQLKIDDRTIVMPEAARELEVPITGAAAMRLVALTPDGRRLEVALAPQQRRVSLDFTGVPVPAASSAAASQSPSPPPLRPRSPVPPRALPRPDPGDGLADSPYGAK